MQRQIEEQGHLLKTQGQQLAEQDQKLTLQGQHIKIQGQHIEVQGRRLAQQADEINNLKKQLQSSQESTIQPSQQGSRFFSPGCRCEHAYIYSIRIEEGSFQY